MITVKHAYINLTFIKNKIENIESCINDGKLITAYHNLQDLKKWNKEMLPVFYKTLSKKQKKELKQGWMPDDDQGGYEK